MNMNMNMNMVYKKSTFIIIFKKARFGGWVGTFLLEANGNVPLDGVTFSRLD